MALTTKTDTYKTRFGCFNMKQNVLYELHKSRPTKLHTTVSTFDLEYVINTSRYPSLYERFTKLKRHGALDIPSRFIKTKPMFWGIKTV